LNKQFDELSKDLATGVSRRSALRRFFIGIGAAVGVLLGRRSAKADNQDLCFEFCFEQYGFNEIEYEKCLFYSHFCPPGECATFLRINASNLYTQYICSKKPCLPNKDTKTAVCVL